MQAEKLCLFFDFSYQVSFSLFSNSSTKVADSRLTVPTHTLGLGQCQPLWSLQKSYLALLTPLSSLTVAIPGPQWTPRIRTPGSAAPTTSFHFPPILAQPRPFQEPLGLLSSSCTPGQLRTSCPPGETSHHLGEVIFHRLGSTCLCRQEHWWESQKSQKKG